jgi:NAD(P)-dependent dehydrogenase (short-subunit alcohol dehydrogenase family)
MGQPRNVADAVVFLASSRSAFMTGSEVVVDGGFTAN